MSSEEYIKGLIQGDRRTISAIYSEIKPIVKSWVLNNSGSEQDADDVFHQSLEALLINYTDIKVDFKALVIRIAQNKWIDQLRKSKKEFQFKQSNASGESFSPSEENKIIEAEKEDMKFQILEQSFLKLSDLCQKLISLLKADYPLEEIIERLEMTDKNTLYRRKFACMKRWKEHLKEDPQFKLIQP